MTLSEYNPWEHEEEEDQPDNDDREGIRADMAYDAQMEAKFDRKCA